MQAVIMAGGKGTRLRPLTVERPKPLVPLLDKPIIAYICAHLHQHNFDHLAVTIGYQGEALQKYLGERTAYGQQVTYASEPEPLGTAGGVRNALGSGQQEPFVVVSGDALTDVDLQEALAFHQSHDGIATLVLSQVDDPSQYGVVETDDAGRIIRFVEKPGPGEAFSDRVNTGIYIFEPEVLEHIPGGSSYDFSRDLFPALMAEGHRLYGYDWHGYWSDVGSLDQYLASQFDLLSGRVAVNVPGTEVSPGVRVAGTGQLPAAVLERVNGPLYVGEDVMVAGGAELTDGVVLGRGSRVGEGARLKGSLLLPSVNVGDHVRGEGAILGHGVELGWGAMVEHGAVVGDGCRIASQARVSADRRIEPGQTVATGRVA